MRNGTDQPEQLGEFFEPGRAYTTQNGYMAPELVWTFACTAVNSAPDGRHIAFGFVQDGTPEWRPTGFMAADFTGHAWRPATVPSWLTSAPAPVSPLAQAEDAKRARDIGGEIGALMAGDQALKSAPWYPAQAGDIVHVHYESMALVAAFGETYLVGDTGDGLLSLQLLTHTNPGEFEGDEGFYATEAADEPLYELWFEAGPDRITIVRHGRVVHDGGAQ